MKPITLFFAALLAVAGFGTGLVVRPHSTKAPAARESSAAPGKLLPGGTAKPRRVPQTSDSSDKSDKRLTLAEIESALAELKGPSREKLWERVGEIAKGIDPADIPQMLAMLSKLPVEIQNSLRYSLVPRWAEADPRAAMEFANGVKNSNERQQMILGVLRGWAQRDPLAAAAWIQQLPPGRLRNEAPGIIARALADLKRAGLRFVQREPGAGTRVVLEELLAAQKISPASIAALDRNEPSHRAAAEAVASGGADATFGIEAAARTRGLGFVALAREHYFLVALRPSLEHPHVRALLDLLRSPAWRAQLSALPGYSANRSGEVLSLRRVLPWWSYHKPKA